MMSAIWNPTNTASSDKSCIASAPVVNPSISASITSISVILNAHAICAVAVLGVAIVSAVIVAASFVILTSVNTLPFVITIVKRKI
ncbi:membrane protein [Candidatus Magnetobacterium bavaricum]|uniref:Membrane protein n=1 Tax=Candidatus Magnetobacterium bavaricum TaxID=29290 RepID=A0A0F3GKH6_9BACT|nr:membrane protein [Candidatus Magnetobacterium bavaricum]